MGDASSNVRECAVCLQLHERVRELEHQVQVLERKNLTDYLTGLPNRRAFENEIEEVMRKSKSTTEKFSIAALDVDFFKRINDNGGHPIGDRVLKSISRLLIELKRDVDFVARWGGEEFMILFPNTALGKAKMLLEDLRVQISQEIGVILNGEWTPVTVSVGVGEIAGNESIIELIERVDLALYRAKDKGKNCVVCSH